MPVILDVAVEISLSATKILASGREIREGPAVLLADGAACDAPGFERLLKGCFDDRSGTLWRVVLIFPSGIIGVVRRRLLDAARSAGAQAIHSLFAPKATAMGVGFPAAEPSARMIVDIGGSTTEVAVLSMGGIVTGESIRVAGNGFDEAILQHMKRNFNLLIGDNTAERIKIQIGSACPLQQELSMEVRGRDIVSNLPRHATITSGEIRKALQEPAQAIVDAVKMTLERTPPEMSADLVENGIVMTGRGAFLRGLDRLIEQEAGLRTRVAQDQQHAALRGGLLWLQRSGGRESRDLP